MFDLIKIAVVIFLIWAGFKIIFNDAGAIGKGVRVVQEGVKETASEIKQGYIIEKNDTTKVK